MSRQFSRLERSSQKYKRRQLAPKGRVLPPKEPIVVMAPPARPKAVTREAAVSAGEAGHRVTAQDGWAETCVQLEAPASRRGL
jgi:hypothetical protein